MERSTSWSALRVLRIRRYTLSMREPNTPQHTVVVGSRQRLPMLGRRRWLHGPDVIPREYAISCFRVLGPGPRWRRDARRGQKAGHLQTSVGLRQQAASQGSRNPPRHQGSGTQYKGNRAEREKSSANICRQSSSVISVHYVRHKPRSTCSLTALQTGLVEFLVSFSSPPSSCLLYPALTILLLMSC